MEAESGQVGATRVGIRQFRSEASRWIRRAERGERVVITINGTAVAQVTDLSFSGTSSGAGDLSPLTLEDLALAGLVEHPMVGVDLVPSNGNRGNNGGSGDPLSVTPTLTPAADIQVDRILSYVRGQQVRSR